MLADGSAVQLISNSTTYADSDSFYIENDVRSNGIMVKLHGHGLSKGMRADVTGTVETSDDGERYIWACSAAHNGDGTVPPLFMSLRSLGGSDWQYIPASGAGQAGVAGGAGLNNIGLLVTLCGRVMEVNGSEGWLKIDDGSERVIKCVAEEGSPVISDSWLNQYAIVTGISSCEFDGPNLVSKIRLKKDVPPVVY